MTHSVERVLTAAILGVALVGFFVFMFILNKKSKQ